MGWLCVRWKQGVVAGAVPNVRAGGACAGAVLDAGVVRPGPVAVVMPLPLLFWVTPETRCLCCCLCRE